MSHISNFWQFLWLIITILRLWWTFNCQSRLMPVMSRTIALFPSVSLIARSVLKAVGGWPEKLVLIILWVIIVVIIVAIRWSCPLISPLKNTIHNLSYWGIRAGNELEVNVNYVVACYHRTEVCPWSGLSYSTCFKGLPRLLERHPRCHFDPWYENGHRAMHKVDIRLPL